MEKVDQFGIGIFIHVSNTWLSLTLNRSIPYLPHSRGFYTFTGFMFIIEKTKKRKTPIFNFDHKQEVFFVTSSFETSSPISVWQRVYVEHTPHPHRMPRSYRRLQTEKEPFLGSQ